MLELFMFIEKRGFFMDFILLGLDPVSEVVVDMFIELNARLASFSGLG